MEIKICPKVCAKCDRYWGIHLTDFDASRFSSRVIAGKDRLFQFKRLELTCVIFNRVGLFEMTIMSKQWKYGQFAEANKFYRSFCKKYGKKKVFKNGNHICFKLENIDKDLEELLKEVNIDSESCPFYVEHMLLNGEKDDTHQS